MKKIGYFFSGFLPILTTTAAQILASFFMFGIAALFLCPASQSTGFDADTIETLLTNTEFNACIMLIYTVTCIVFMGIWYYRSCGGNYLPKPSLTFHPLQFLSIILLIPGMQFFSGYLTSAVSLLFPNWLSQYEKLMETAGLDSDIGLFMFIYAVILGPVCEELVFRRHHASGPTGTSVLGCQPDAGGSLRNLSHELDSGNLCICSRSCTGMDL